MSRKLPGGGLGCPPDSNVPQDWRIKGVQGLGNLCLVSDTIREARRFGMAAAAKVAFECVDLILI
jgi:hypothetical protein